MGRAMRKTGPLSCKGIFLTPLVHLKRDFRNLGVDTIEQAVIIGVSFFAKVSSRCDMPSRLTVQPADQVATWLVSTACRQEVF